MGLMTVRFGIIPEGLSRFADGLTDGEFSHFNGALFLIQTGKTDQRIDERSRSFSVWASDLSIHLFSPLSISSTLRLVAITVMGSLVHGRHR